MTTPERTRSIEALLAAAERAHGAYEAAELGGVYDLDWPRWYAAYAVEHGLADLVGRPVDADRLAELLIAINSRFERIETAARPAWGAYVARRIATEL